jgi:bifunctional N-acetylglucosamine-1-phosphate-uridyltransferase/glucosamine-1-phosphate-acetyltransferase GlmU-like protein
MNTLAAIVLAAGKGTRMKSERAKVTFPLPINRWRQEIIDTALALDCEKVAVVVGWKKDTVISCLK